jgi:hypothetical protein
MLSVHPSPGVITDPQLAQRDGEPGGVSGADRAVVAVTADGVAHRHLPEGGSKPGWRHPHARRVQPGGAAGDVRVRPRGRPSHRGGRLTARRGERRDELIAAGEHLAVARQGTRRRMPAHVERRPLRRAAGRVGAQAGPVPLTINAEQFSERDPGFRGLFAQRGGDRRDGRVTAVPHGDRGADALGGHQPDGVAGNGGGGPRALRVRQVVPERDPDLR